MKGEAGDADLSLNGHRKSGADQKSSHVVRKMKPEWLDDFDARMMKARIEREAQKEAGVNREFRSRAWL